MDLKDLNIDSDILNLFNYTLNDNAKYKVKLLMAKPLQNEDAVKQRQHILKGFISNIALFTNYAYSKIDFREVDLFLQNFTTGNYLPKFIKYRLWVSKQRYYVYRAHCVQLILLYYKLHNQYIKKLSTAAFPEAYKDDIRFIDAYLSGFNTASYEELIRKGSLRTKHILEIFKLIEKKHDDIFLFQEKYTLFEAYLSISTGIHFNDFSFPVIKDNGISLRNFYHPLLKKPVKNNITSLSNVILLTGPNMSGKSTLLKAIGICIYLGSLGFAVPATEASMPLYNNISVFINLNDDLQSGYSHFMTEILNLKKVVTEVSNSKRSFAIFDELFRGTNVDDALEISRTTLKGMLNYPDSLFLVSSHLHELTAMPEVENNSIQCHYLDCDLKDDTPVFTYRLKRGWSNLKIGRILFEKEGLNAIFNLNSKV